MRTLYTDGAFSSADNAGGWAWVDATVNPDDTLVVHRFDSGAVTGGSSNQMEITAAIQALEAYRFDSVMIVSDSAYVVNCFNQSWYPGWRRRGWVNTANKPVKNRELWEQLIDLYERRTTDGLVTVWRHVRGHSGDPGNTEADRLAVEARKNLGWQPRDTLPTGFVGDHASVLGGPMLLTGELVDTSPPARVSGRQGGKSLEAAKLHLEAAVAIARASIPNSDDTVRSLLEEVLRD